MDLKKICSRCVYNDSVPGIQFDEKNICNYCKQHDQLEKEYPTDKTGQASLDKWINQIKKQGQNKKYDCAVGVSGGCDSSFLIYKLVELGLRPLAVHFDNTWNSPIATRNIFNVLNKLNIDLHTYVVNNEEYDDIYRSFFKAGVKDIETPTDIALAATLYRAAEKYGLKYIIEGHSFRTEGIAPLNWFYIDGKYVTSVQKQFGSYALKTFPNMSLYSFLKWSAVKNIKRFRPLYYINYNKDNAKKLLSKEFAWEYYGGHHLENRFTAFAHTYFYPKRFNMDTRLLGHAALVRSNQMTRDDALNELATPQPYDPDLLMLVKKRLGFSDSEFDHLMTLPHKSYRDYKTYKKAFEKLKPLFWILYKSGKIPKSFYIKFTKKDS